MRMKRKAGAVLIIFAVVALMLVSCLKTEENPADTEIQAIETFLGNNPDLNFIRTSTGLYHHEVEPGAGEVIQPHDTALVIYTGKFLSGITFDSNVGGDSLKFPIGRDVNIIPGFEEAVSLMKEGGEAVFLMPSSLAYGALGYGPIPGYTPLLFEIELARIIPGPGK